MNAILSALADEPVPQAFKPQMPALYRTRIGRRAYPTQRQADEYEAGWWASREGSSIPSSKLHSPFADGFFDEERDQQDRENTARDAARERFEA